MTTPTPANDPPKPLCPDCKVDMVIGWLPERGHHNWIEHSYWREGIPQVDWMFGLQSIGKPTPITAWRCPHCYLLRQYAIAPPKKQWRKVD